MGLDECGEWSVVRFGGSYLGLGDGERYLEVLEYELSHGEIPLHPGSLGQHIVGNNL